MAKKDVDLTYTVSSPGTSHPSYTPDDYTITIGELNDNPTTFTLDTISNVSDFTYDPFMPEQKYFVDAMPCVERIEEMCEEYPALQKVYEQFKLIYKMTEQDYKGKLKEKGLDDDIPF